MDDTTAALAAGGRRRLADRVRGDAPRSAAEDAFRRGYHQGVAAALDFAAAPRTTAELAAYEDAVADWRNGQGRFAGTRGLPCPPPGPPRPGEAEMGP